MESSSPQDMIIFYTPKDWVKAPKHRYIYTSGINKILAHIGGIGNNYKLASEVLLQKRFILLLLSTL